MIMVGNQRGGASGLASHLLNTHDNEHVEVHEIRGFASETVHGAFNEAYAQSKATKCQKFLFSLSLNPAAYRDVSTADFEYAIENAEDRLGLTNQARVVVFHEKGGRRHCHTVWSRIDTEEMKAVHLAFTHRKLQEVSRDLHQEYDWRMPRGLEKPGQADSLNYSHAEHQHAKRLDRDPKAIKAALQVAWANSQDGVALSQTLKDQGYVLAKGDRRGFVVIDQDGNPFALGKKWLGVPAKEIRDRVGETDQTLPSVDQAKEMIANDLATALMPEQRYSQETPQDWAEKQEARKADLITQHQIERKAVYGAIESRRIEEAKTRHAGDDPSADAAQMRDATEKDDLIKRQLDQRQKLDQFHARKPEDQNHSHDRFEQQHIEAAPEPHDLRDTFLEARQSTRNADPNSHDHEN